MRRYIRVFSLYALQNFLVSYARGAELLPKDLNNTNIEPTEMSDKSKEIQAGTVKLVASEQ